MNKQSSSTKKKRGTENKGRLSLRRNFSWVLVGNLVYAMAQWAMIVVLAKIGTIEMVGIFAFGLAVTAPITIFLNLKLRAVLATDAKNEYLIGHYFALRILSTLFSLIIFACIALFGSYDQGARQVLFLIGLARAFDSLSDILYGYLQKYERMDLIAISRIIQGVGQLSILTIVLILTDSLLMAVFAWALLSGLITCTWDIYSVCYIKKRLSKEAGIREVDVQQQDVLSPQWNFKVLSKLALLSVPLGLAVMGGSLQINIPRYFIEFYMGVDQLGIYVAISSLVFAGSTVVAALGQAATPRLAKYFAGKDYTKFNRLIGRLMLLGLMIGLGGMFVAIIAGKYLLTILYTPEYSLHSKVLTLLMIAFAINFCFIFLGTGLQGMRNFRIQLPIQLTSVITVTLFSYILIPQHGLIGAAMAVVATSLVVAVAYSFCYYYTCKTLQI